MIFAELHGKLGADYSRAHERAEDLLTSTVFGLLRYLPPADGLLAVLRRARPVRVSGQRVEVGEPGVDWFDLERVAEVRIDFWPPWGKHGEPDLLLTLRDGNRKPVAVVVIEAKLYSPKSGRASDDNSLADDAHDPDQLVNYWKGLQSRDDVPAGKASVIYLTRHGAPPIEELVESARRAPAMQLAWLSWRNVWEVVEGLAGASLVADDLARLLAHKGLKHFNGFHAEPWQAPSVRSFWRPVTWFSQVDPWHPGHESAGFWHQERGA
jgi:hypothetical protein